LIQILKKGEIMKEKELNKETNQDNTKLTWEAPRLYCLDKGKTEGGTPEPYSESYVGAPGS